MTTKIPTGIADPFAMPEVDDNILRPDFSAPPDSSGDFFGFMSQAMNRKSVGPRNSSDSDQRPDEKDSPGRIQKSRPEKKEDNANCTDAPVTTATAVPAQATTPASQDGEQPAAGNAPINADQEAAAGTQGQGSTIGTELPNLNEEGAAKVPPAQAAAAATQLVEHQAQAKVAERVVGARIKDGISVAPNSRQMKSTPEKDENAGRTLQKLPRTPAVEKPAEAADANADGQTAGRDSSSRFEAPVTVHAITSAEKFVAVASGGLNDTSSTTPAAQNVPVQVERISRLVSQEVVMIKQSGATSLAVSLKVDSRTELFLQLTNHDGQLQASLRLERGDFVGLDRHWGQLQDSLARQNIQLLPLEQKGGANNFSSSSDHSAQRHADGSQEQHHRGQFREAKEQTTSNESEVATARGRGKKTKKSGGSGFESWA